MVAVFRSVFGLAEELSRLLFDIPHDCQEHFFVLLELSKTYIAYWQGRGMTEGLLCINVRSSLNIETVFAYKKVAELRGPHLHFPRHRGPLQVRKAVGARLSQ